MLKGRSINDPPYSSARFLNCLLSINLTKNSSRIQNCSYNSSRSVYPARADRHPMGADRHVDGLE
jgi:hypothetical protein